MANQLGKINHIVHVMLENRSFDQMLGFLYSDNGNKSASGQDFDGLTGDESNPDESGAEHKVFKILPSDPHPYFMPGADPGEGFENTNYQVFSTPNVEAGTPATNKGFVKNFKSAIATDLTKHYKDSLPGTLPEHIMGMYPPDMLPVLSGLAKGYAVCDAWFSSVPTMTMPNRAFALAGTSQGHLDDKQKSFTCPSIFGRLSDKGVDWAIFGYNADPLTRLDFSDTKYASEAHFGHFRDFQSRAQAGTLPAYSFLEPSWDANGNSQHPNYDVSKGEQLLRDVYDAVRTGKAWEATLLIITYDEHGGNYDHVAPPNDATPPGDGTVGEDDFDFSRFGLRVPAVLVSPWIEAGTVFRAVGPKRIDHTSVLRTIHDRFGTAALTARDAAAASLADALTRESADLTDRINGVKAPVSKMLHPNTSTVSKLELHHADNVSALQIRNAQGHFSDGPQMSTSNSSHEVSNFIRDRTAAWKAHIARRKASAS